MVTSETLTIKEVERLNRNIDNLKKVASFLNAEILFENLKNVQLTDRQLANKLNLQYIKPFYSKAYGSKTLSVEKRNKAYWGYRNSLLLSAQEDFDSYMLFMEIDRPIEERYWVHRRDKLWKACQALQDMTDDKIDVTFIAMPPRVGKSGLGLFYCSWIAGKYPQLSLLGIAFNNFLVDSFHGKLLNIIDNRLTYKFYEVFPTLENTLKVNKEYNLIDLGKKNEYGTIALRSIESGLAGGVEASSLFYFDDLISGIEEAVSPDRLKSKWDKFTGDGFQRMIGSKLKILFIGTIWSINDPQMLFRKHLEENTDKRVAIIEIPALDENEESNFDYKYKGISTKTYTQMIRPAVDEVTWKCVYMQEPIERQGLLFSIDQFARFDSDKLRDTPKAIHTFCDVAWGGGDNLAMPFIYEYDDGYYLADVVFNKCNKTITEPIVAFKLQRHKCYQAFFESNNGGDEYADNVKKCLQKNGFGCRIVSRRSDNGENAKFQRILKFSPEIQDLHILETNQQSQEYKDFMRNIITFNQNGKNRHDDACDATALLFNELIKPQQSKVTICRRIF